MATSATAKYERVNLRDAGASAKIAISSKARATKTAQANRAADSALGNYKAGTPLSIVATTLRDATPMQRVDAERQGVAARLVKEMASEMEIPAIRMFKIIGVPKATAERKAEKNQAIAGGGGQAALGLLNLLGIAQTIVADSTDERAEKFDVAKWLGRWIENPQPALGGRKPADLLDTPTGMDVVARMLGSLQSGAYQ
ncbi:MAG: antitoxin Xre/MbcA/ParS toxin-binding domain-containing protein [Dokdonella sp.]